MSQLVKTFDLPAHTSCVIVDSSRTESYCQPFSEGKIFGWKGYKCVFLNKNGLWRTIPRDK